MDEGNVSASPAPGTAQEVAAVASILQTLSSFDNSTIERIIHSVAAFYGISLRGSSQVARPSSSFQAATTGATGDNTFSEDRTTTPKQFMFEKQPKTDVEKVACLGYYLTHYRNTPHFKTLDISKLNTEAAQIKFSNPADALDNALKQNYLAQGTKGNKQLSAVGELFVQALPDREKAKEIMATARPRRKARKTESEPSEDKES